MIEKLREASRRIRRTVAQRGLRGAFGNIARRVRSGNFSLAQEKPLVLADAHPFDVASGLDTGGFIHGAELKTGHPHDVYSIAYYGSAPSLVQAVLDRWQPTPGTKPLDQYTFIDFGSGKGRVVLLAARLPFRKCIGVELNQALHATAAENMERWKDSENAISPMQAVCQSAAEFSFPETPCVAYLFNPFTAKVLSQVRDRMAAAFANRPGELDILYVNDEFRSLFEEHPGFTMLWESPIAMSPEDSAADILHEVETFRERPADGVRKYPCSAWRWVGHSKP